MKNYAFEIGRRENKWWPDWSGDCVAIIGGGPSIKQTDLSILKDRIHIIAIKTAIDLVPWAEVVYGCDAPWWLDRRGLPKFGGLKFFHGPQAANHWKDMHRVEIVMGKDEMLVDLPLKIGNGGCSGFQSLNLAVQFGASDIILVGFDLHDRGGVHWYGRNKWDRASNPMPSNFNRWNKGFAAALPSLNKLGITVVNASTESELKPFPKKSLQETIEEWGL